MRILKELYGLDLSKATFHRFMDLKFTGEDGIQVCLSVFMLLLLLSLLLLLNGTDIYASQASF